MADRRWQIAGRRTDGAPALEPSMEGSRYRSLQAYELAAALADDLRVVVLAWNPLDAWTTGIQLLRAADSIGANIAEAFGRHGFPDQRRLLYVARGSAYETEHWVERAVVRGLLPADFRPRARAAIRTLNGLIRAHHRA